ncbi:radical SAM mobile pair system MarR family transcriptional regulator [Paenibacillus apis]|uniref:Radical SAM mobile pair system MarR family transcriptional regulator n=1 Tax=Paenibacillus apis TaxID=1792174 RepID=A0A919Y1F2_9BACL|nr:radical SAM mobile pair system MarR family transcriptional regulator [Paenibacillus apis]
MQKSLVSIYIVLYYIEQLEVRKLVAKTSGGFLISKIKQIQGRLLEKALIEHGITQFNGAQGRILFVLWDNDNIPISELSEKTGLAKTTLTSMLDRLEKSGHIQRVHDPTNRRIIRIRLTEAARNLQEQYNKVSEKMNAIFYEGFSDDEIFTFENSLRKVLENLAKKEKDYE